MPFRKIVLAISCVVWSCAFAGCGINIFPVSKDVELGKQVDKEIRGNAKQYPIMKGHDDVRQYVRTVANTVLQSSEVKYRGTFPYTVDIIQDDKTVNAFCTPGGYIYVYTGLLKYIDNEATLAGVLAHEIAHAERRHATQHMTNALGMQELVNVALGNSPSQVAKIGANLFSGLALLQHTRSEEAEADEYSFKYLKSTATYYPGGIKYFFEKILRTNKGGGAVDNTLNRFLSDHPLSEDRLNAIETLLKDNKIGPPSEQTLRMAAFKSMQGKLP